MKSSKPSKSVECVHRITSFQAHRDCFEGASICERECQSLHKTNNEGFLLSVSAVEDQLRLIRDLIIREIKKYSDRMRQVYGVMALELQRQQTENLKELEKELMTELAKSIALEKSVVDKVVNKRYEHIKCHELMTFMEESNIQQKIKKGALTSIYAKYQLPIQKYRQHIAKSTSCLKEPKPTLTNPENPAKPLISIAQSLNASKPPTPSNQTKFFIPPKPVQSSSAQPLYSSQNPQQQQLGNKSKPDSSNDRPFSALELSKSKMFEQRMRNLQRENRELMGQYEKKKYESQVLVAQNKNLQREVERMNSWKPAKKVAKLAHTTWNILQVSTKKIKKAQKSIPAQDQRQARRNQEVGMTKAVASNPAPTIVPEGRASISQPEKMVDEAQAPSSKQVRPAAIEPIPASKGLDFEVSSVIRQVSRPKNGEKKILSTSDFKEGQKKSSIEGSLTILDVSKSANESQVKPIEENSDESSDFLSYFKKRKFF